MYVERGAEAKAKREAQQSNTTLNAREQTIAETAVETESNSPS